MFSLRNKNTCNYLSIMLETPSYLELCSVTKKEEVKLMFNFVVADGPRANSHLSIISTTGEKK